MTDFAKVHDKIMDMLLADPSPYMRAKGILLREGIINSLTAAEAAAKAEGIERPDFLLAVTETMATVLVSMCTTKKLEFLAVKVHFDNTYNAAVRDMRGGGDEG